MKDTLERNVPQVWKNSFVIVLKYTHSSHAYTPHWLTLICAVYALIRNKEETADHYKMDCLFQK